MPKKKTVEERLEELEEIVEKLDEGDAPIEELLKEFEVGMKLIAGIRDFLEKAELKIQEITKETSPESIQED